MKDHAMRLESLDIALYYGHPEVGVWSLHDVKEQRVAIHLDDQKPGAFLKAYGAIRMYCNRFVCFLDTDADYELRWYVYFLLNSLLSQADRRLAAHFPGVSVGDPFFGYERVAAGLYEAGGTILLLQDLGDEFELSYLDPRGQTPERRLSPYFRDVRIAKQLWQSAAAEALDEYFSIAGEILQNGTHALLQQLVSSWRAYRHRFG